MGPFSVVQLDVVADGAPGMADRLVSLRISVMVISRFGERDQFGRWCCAVNRL